MCINKVNGEKMKYSDELLEEITPVDHPSTEQFSMLLNLLPTNTVDQVLDMDNLRVDEADILMAAVNYILSLTSQLQEKLRWNARPRSDNFHGGR
eukprot:TRINITY_DN27143_c0_g1_i1.p2 TRINITY_DN27143_c0_g1~~TRINITY_DN27143_c0_g1_i1.p2  ORF type:complete len:109 (+),score=37.05 TRINITY_DN27143_c0_g1_i1:44-328(+)